MSEDVKLLPLPELLAENERLRAEVSGLRAARIAYASEFPATTDGDPDTGNIHANIRALKARAERLAEVMDKEISVWAGRMSSRGWEKKWPEARAVHSALRSVRRALAGKKGGTQE